MAGHPFGRSVVGTGGGTGSCMELREGVVGELEQSRELGRLEFHVRLKFLFGKFV